MTLLVLFSLIYTCLIASTQARKCGPSPIYVDVHVRQVHGSSDLPYGSFIGVGTPAQNQSLWPSIVHNETYLAAENYCDGADSQCSGIVTGGLFNVSDSTSFITAPSYQTLDSTNSTSVLFGSDTIHLYQHFFETDGATQFIANSTPITVLEDGTFGEVLKDPAHQGAIVGLGPDSPLLHHLFMRELTPSESFSLYLGTGFERAGGAVNGSLTLGGYDSSRFNGSVSSFNLTSNPTDGNPFRVGVKQITVHSTVKESSTNIDLMGSNEVVTASISTDQYPITLSPEILERFISSTNATPASSNINNDNSLAISSTFTGSLSIQLSTGLIIKFPPAWLRNVSNISPISSISSNTSSSSADIILGTSFLSYVYLMTSYTDGFFHLAPAVQAAPFITTTSWCPGDTPEQYKKPDLSPLTKYGITGAIVGGVVGGCAISIVAFFGARWAHNQRREKSGKFKDVLFYKGEDHHDSDDHNEDPRPRPGDGVPISHTHPSRRSDGYAQPEVRRSSEVDEDEDYGNDDPDHAPGTDDHDRPYAARGIRRKLWKGKGKSRDRESGKGKGYQTVDQDRERQQERWYQMKDWNSRTDPA